MPCIVLDKGGELVNKAFLGFSILLLWWKIQMNEDTFVSQCDRYYYRSRYKVNLKDYRRGSGKAFGKNWFLSSDSTSGRCGSWGRAFKAEKDNISRGLKASETTANQGTESCSQLLKCRSVQSLSRVQCFVTPWTAACQDSLFFTISWSLLKFMSIELVKPSNHLILCCPLLLLPLILSSIRVFSNELAPWIRWPKY